LEASGHQVRVAEDDVTGCCDTLVVLHALRSRRSVADFRSRKANGKVVMVLTGTDIYGGQCAEVEEAMRTADRLVVLQPKAMEKVPAQFRGKTRVILQSAVPMAGPAASKSVDPFQVCVVGHLREVKDPLRAARAARLLPVDSKIVIRQAGGIIEERFRGEVEREERDNGRYEWLGELDTGETRRLMAASQLMVISSWSEGGAAVVAESVVEGTPILAARSDGVAGMLGDDYGGFFAPGDTGELARQLQRAENEPGFLAGLRARCEELAPKFDPAEESARWNDLLRELECCA
jgi:putative glycosyltransferase (TIGR04348 family)